MRHISRLAANLGLYLALFIPLTFVLGFTEGVITGYWEGSWSAFRYQLAGWSGSEWWPLAWTAPLAVAGTHLAVGFFGRGRTPRGRRAVTVLAAIGCAALASALIGVGLGFLLFPLSFSLAGGVYGMIFIDE